MALFCVPTILNGWIGEILNGRNNDWDYADEQKTHFDRIAAGRGEIDAPYRQLLLKSL